MGRWGSSRVRSDPLDTGLDLRRWGLVCIEPDLNPYYMVRLGEDLLLP